MSPLERQEEILRSLSELTRVRSNDRSLSPDFRLQLQILECSVQQQRLLQQVAEQQRRAAQQIEAMHCNATHCQDSLQQHLGKVVQGLEQVGQKLDQQADALKSTDTNLREAATADGSEQSPAPALRYGVSFGSSGSGQDKVALAFAMGKDTGFSRGTSPIEGRTGSKSETSSTTQKKLKKATSNVSLVAKPDDPLLHKIVKGQFFDLLCGFVIACNAATMGLQTGMGLAWRLDNLGVPTEVPTHSIVRTLGFCYTGFYILEILLKFIVFGKGFFISDMWKWNCFDLLLVLVGVYDVLMDLVSPDAGGTNVGWMRLLRLFKMMKLLRVVRVMRIFRVLRMMLNSIAGSLTTLAWSILMLTLLMYVFSLCFLQILTGYLSDTPVSEIPEGTVESIKTYWGSVYQSIITLYYAVTGGADWEPLAQPIRDAGEGYYQVFLFYIAFTAFAVLNVLTGLYVDTATKISEEDDESVGEELATRTETIGIKTFFAEKLDRAGDDPAPLTVSMKDFERNIEEEPVKAFMKMADLTPMECRRIFKMLDFEETGDVVLEDFVNGCLHSKSASQNMDMLTLLAETKRSIQQGHNLHELFEKKMTSLTEMVTEMKQEAVAAIAPRTSGTTRRKSVSKANDPSDGHL